MQSLHVQLSKKRIDAAYAKSPEALIAVAVQDADTAFQAQGYNKNYPKNKMAYATTQSFSSEGQFFTYMGSALNYWSAKSDQEHMCNVYTVRFNDGSIEYIAGPVYSGVHNNVILPYLLFSGAEVLSMNLQAEYRDAEIQYEGMLHSHPYCDGHEKNIFSWGDAAAALFSGRTWLTAPDGTLYALERGEAAPVLRAGLLRNSAYGQARKNEFTAIRNPMNFLIPGIRGYDVTAVYPPAKD